MKKFVAIKLLVLYLASFAGMVLGQDCQAQDFHKDTLTEFFTVCNKANGHAPISHGHPLQQFCKVIEVHKEVLVSHNHQAADVPLQSATSQKDLFVVRQAPRQAFIHSTTSPNRLFIINRVLLL